MLVMHLSIEELFSMECPSAYLRKHYMGRLQSAIEQRNNAGTTYACNLADHAVASLLLACERLGIGANAKFLIATECDRESDMQ